MSEIHLVRCDCCGDSVEFGKVKGDWFSVYAWGPINFKQPAAKDICSDCFEDMFNEKTKVGVMGYAEQEALISVSPEKAAKIKEIMVRQCSTSSLWEPPMVKGFSVEACLEIVRLQDELVSLHGLLEKAFNFGRR